MKAVNNTTNELISVNLNTLLHMAKSAAMLKLHPSTIRSKQSGGFVSAFKGRGMEFDEARLYQPGDDIRCIDWRVTARTGKTHTKIFREERERPVFISVDHRPAMFFATRGVFKSVQAAKIAALLAWKAQLQGDRLGGQLLTDSSCQELKPQNGRHGVLRFFNALVKPQPPANKQFTLNDAIARLVQHARPGSLVYIISDFRGFDEHTENHLAKLSRHCDVVLIQIHDPLESQLPGKGRYRFTDGHSDTVIDTVDKTQTQHYQQRYLDRLNSLLEFVNKTGISIIQCSTTEDPFEVLR
ncbi:MAG: DUF58 domain-containing protein [Methylococcales bacterium]|jgi:uncharacterized protein (DUF58 family)|nr:DUF58 domain-containing protein [Methylococcaceae bacterium]